jgi:hypothetical protein
VERPPADVLADLLVAAAERGSEKLVTTDRLLRELAGDRAVNEAHAVWTDRIRGGLLRGSATREPEPAEDAFELTRRLRAETSKHMRERVAR